MKMLLVGGCSHGFWAAGEMSIVCAITQHFQSTCKSEILEAEISSINSSSDISLTVFRDSREEV
jgi:hypothetical protein